MGDTSEIRTKTRLVLEKRHQLIDLNKEYVNFEIFFECRSADATKDFEMLVINQEQLNTIDLTNLVMKKTRGGYISGNIVADEDKYQNYFLVIRALDEDSHDVDLEIALKPIPADSQKIAAATATTTTAEIPPHDVVSCQTNDSTTNNESTTKTSNKRQMYILIGILVAIVLCIIGYVIYTRYYCDHPTNEDKAVVANSKDDDVFSDSGSSSSGTASIVSKRSAASEKSKNSVKSEGLLLATLINNKNKKNKKKEEAT